MVAGLSQTNWTNHKGRVTPKVWAPALPEMSTAIHQIAAKYLDTLDPHPLVEYLYNNTILGYVESIMGGL
jgi:hypothetical protein